MFIPCRSLIHVFNIPFRKPVPATICNPMVLIKILIYRLPFTENCLSSGIAALRILLLPYFCRCPQTAIHLFYIGIGSQFMFDQLPLPAFCPAAEPIHTLSKPSFLCRMKYNCCWSDQWSRNSPEKQRWRTGIWSAIFLPIRQNWYPWTCLSIHAVEIQIILSAGKRLPASWQKAITQQTKWTSQTIMKISAALFSKLVKCRHCCRRPALLPNNSAAMASTADSPMNCHRVPFFNAPITFTNAYFTRAPADPCSKIDISKTGNTQYQATPARYRYISNIAGYVQNHRKWRMQVYITEGFQREINGNLAFRCHLFFIKGRSSVAGSKASPLTGT